jgi:hypothetical protein
LGGLNRLMTNRTSDWTNHHVLLTLQSKNRIRGL